MVGWESVGKAMIGSVYDHICVRVYVFKSHVGKRR
jgi:hypothetical protein